ncbi:MAG: hypothetical protein RMX68_012445 [Aulosira sp. ZfuVER01]|nr:hypothetical protein [Aulosira sp. ZfuVER01]MDZ7999255.1 hypothetical protein [Aulosira sp. DedVER01a]MDZ8051964.1 hypothetical protein [Aulosira sp. ZfuCHP01]
MIEKFLLAVGLTFSLSLFTGMNWSAPSHTTGSINLNNYQAFTVPSLLSTY